MPAQEIKREIRRIATTHPLDLTNIPETNELTAITFVPKVQNNYLRFILDELYNNDLYKNTLISNIRRKLKKDIGRQFFIRNGLLLADAPIDILDNSIITKKKGLIRNKKFLYPQKLQELALSPDIIKILHKQGIFTVGHLASLTPHDHPILPQEYLNKLKKHIITTVDAPEDPPMGGYNNAIAMISQQITDLLHDDVASQAFINHYNILTRTINEFLSKPAADIFPFLKAYMSPDLINSLTVGDILTSDQLYRKLQENISHSLQLPNDKKIELISSLSMLRDIIYLLGAASPVASNVDIKLGDKKFSADISLAPNKRYAVTIYKLDRQNRKHFYTYTVLPPEDFVKSYLSRLFPKNQNPPRRRPNNPPTP